MASLPLQQWTMEQPAIVWHKRCEKVGYMHVIHVMGGAAGKLEGRACGGGCT